MARYTKEKGRIRKILKKKRRWPADAVQCPICRKNWHNGYNERDPCPHSKVDVDDHYEQELFEARLELALARRKDDRPEQAG